MTEHNVEKGANVSDHVRPGLDKVTLEVFVSNTPLYDVNGAYNVQLESVELDVPVFKPKVYPTPGSLISTVTGALGDLIKGKTSYKAQVLKMEKANVVKDALTTLDGWRASGTVGKVFLPWKTYDSMVITKIVVHQQTDHGDAAEFSIDLQEIRLVEALMVSAPKPIPTETRGKAKVAKGRQPTSFVREPAPAKKSTLAAITKKR